MSHPQESICTQAAFYHDDKPLALKAGGTLDGFTLAYETYGKLSKNKDNAILLFHALTGSQNAAGITEEVEGIGERWTSECQQGWWDGFIGPGKALDTDRFFVICANYIGGCYGSTGPASINPATGKPFGGSFPRIALADVVDSQVRLLDNLKIDQLHATIGPSMGGMLCLSLATRYPDRVRNVIPMGSGLQASRLQKIHNLEQIVAIETDRKFEGGDYYESGAPNRGLALARMIGHKTFISLSTLERRATSRIEQPATNEGGWYQLSSNIESYLHHQGTKFVKRFDANTYLRILDAWQSFDPAPEAGANDVTALFEPCRDQRYLIFTIDSDVCFYPGAQAQIESALTSAKVPNMRITVHSDKGHDSFLLEPELFTPHLAYALGVAK